jgi:hypothetical protein
MESSAKALFLTISWSGLGGEIYKEAILLLSIRSGPFLVQRGPIRVPELQIFMENLEGTIENPD